MLFPAIAPIFWAKGAVALVAFAATIPAVRYLAEPLRKLISGEPDWAPEQLLQKVGITDVNEVTPTFGYAVVPSGDQRHLVEIRCREGVISPRGTRVLLEEFEPAEYFFWVVKVEQPASE